MLIFLYDYQRNPFSISNRVSCMPVNAVSVNSILKIILGLCSFIIRSSFSVVCKTKFRNITCCVDKCPSHRLSDLCCLCTCYVISLEKAEITHSCSLQTPPLFVKGCRALQCCGERHRVRKTTQADIDECCGVSFKK